MNPLPRIPSPAAQRWREFRVRLLPLLAFLAAFAFAAVLWNRHIAAPAATGEVERVQLNVSSPLAGRLAQLHVTRFQTVNAGDVIGLVSTTEPAVAAASLALIRAEIESLRVGMAPAANLQRNALNHDQLRMDSMVRRVELATAKVDLELAEKELDRTQKLFAEKIVSESALDRDRSLRDAARARVAEQSRLVEEIEAALKQYRPLEPSTDGPSLPPSVRAAIAVQEEQLRLTEAQISPIKLVAPVKGVVSQLLRLAGESVAAADPVVVLTSDSPTQIIGFVRHPIAFEPKVGMPIRIRAQTADRRHAMGRVLHVGTQMELVSAPLRLRGFNNATERGLAFAVSLPPELKLHPGELVDLIFETERN